MMRLHRPLALVLSIAVTAAGVAACGAGRDILGTNTSPCFLTLPVAKKAVKGRGSLAGVRLVDVNRLTPGERALRNLLDQLPIPSSHEVCLVAFTRPDRTALRASADVRHGPVCHRRGHDPESHAAGHLRGSARAAQLQA
jgi:hypothetical protein